MLVLQLAVRNIWRQRRRNTLVMFAIVVSIGGVFVMNALARGMERDFLEGSVTNLRGHIKLLAPNFRYDPNLKHVISADTNWDAIADIAAIEGSVVRLRTPAVIMSERETRGIELIGIDPQNVSHSFIGELSYAGEPLEHSNDTAIVIGKQLANELQTTVGRRLVVIFNGPDEQAIERGYRVQGVFDAPNRLHEEIYVLTGLAALQEIAGVQAVSEMSIYLHNVSQTALVKSELVSAYPNLEVYTWAELDLFTGEMYGFIGFTVYILIVVFMCTLIFGLINALVTAVLERAREFGMLRAVGMKSRSVVLQVVIECLIIMMVSLIVGLGIGLLLVLWLSDGIDLTAFAEGVEAFGMQARMTPHLIADDFVILTIASILLGLVASYFPARRIIKTSILQSLRDG